MAAQGRNEEVLRDYTPDGLDPNEAAAVLIARARAQINLGRPKDAAASAADAQRLAPKSVDAAMTSARLALASKDPAAAQTHVTEALAIDPHSLQALMLQAQLQAGRGERTTALASFGTAIDRAQATGASEAVDQLRLQRAGLLLATGDDAGAHRPGRGAEIPAEAAGGAVPLRPPVRQGGGLESGGCRAAQSGRCCIGSPRAT